ncbi:MAG: hypothetical protein AB8G96_13845 [Phycisphaerales bacterium]
MTTSVNPTIWTLEPANGPGRAAVLRDAAGHPRAHVLPGNPLADDWSPPASLPSDPGDLILWTGAMGDGPFAPHPHTWMSPGRTRLTERLADLAEALSRGPEPGRRLLLRPHARHVLSDPPSVRSFLRDAGDLPIGLCLEPAALFEATMLGDAAEEHVERILGGLGDLTDVHLRGDVEPPAGVPIPDPLPASGKGPLVAGPAPDAPCELVPAGEGHLPMDQLDAAADRWLAVTAIRVEGSPGLA